MWYNIYMGQIAFPAVILLEYEGELPDNERIKTIIESGNISDAKVTNNSYSNDYHPVIYLKELK